MSQVKVDKHKELKHNRKKIVKMNKIKRLVSWSLTCVVLVAAVGWLGWSSYTKIQESKADEVISTTADTSAISDYMNSLNAEDAQ